MSKCKRLFLFAAYDAHGIIDGSLTYYVRALSELGDVVFVMDADSPESELNKIKPYVLTATATRHGEYDFGSYRRAYMYARDSAILDTYDFIYLVNDSVYGPLYNLEHTLDDMESKNWDAFGLVCNPHREHPHIQSWFIGCRKTVFLSQWFDAFMMSVTKQPEKGAITKLYEQGFTKRVIENNLTWGCLYNVRGRGVYNKVKKLYRAKMPFMKKNAFPRNHGALGRQILYVLNRIDPALRCGILENAERVYGGKYIHWLLTSNPIKIIIRNIRHGAIKLFSGQI